MGHIASRHRRTALIAACLVTLAAGGAGYWYWGKGPGAALAAKPPARAGVPVSIAVAARQDIPIYLSGLGTVQGVFTVGIHSEDGSKDLQVFGSELRANDQLQALFQEPKPDDAAIGIRVAARLEIAHEDIRIRNHRRSRSSPYHSSSSFPAITKFFHDFFGLLHAKFGTASCAGRSGNQFLVGDTLHVVAQYLFRERLSFLALLASDGNKVLPKLFANHYFRQDTLLSRCP